MMRRAVGVLALGLVLGCGPPLALAQDQCSKAGSADLGFRLRFDADGHLSQACEAELQRILDAATSSTDIFIFSHGWWNDPESAEESYTRFISEMRAVRPAILRPTYRPLLVGIYWPSAYFPLGSEAEKETGLERNAPAKDQARDHFAKLFNWLPMVEGTDRDLAQIGKLLEKERAGQSITREDFRQLAKILKRWEVLAQPDADEESDREDVESPGENSIFSLNSADLAEYLWENSYAGSGEEGLEARKPSILSVLNVFTFWQMKRRAGVVGESGVHDFLQMLREKLHAAGNLNARTYLVGHSFGGKLLSSALVGKSSRNQNRATFLVLIQSAFSHFAFAKREDIADLGIESRGLTEGRYADVMRNGLVAKRVVVTYSDRDTPNRFWYPLGVRVTGDVLERRAISPPKYGALGADGAQRSGARELVLPRGTMQWRLSDFPEKVVNLNASQVIGGHGKYFEKELYGVLWQLVTEGD
jgi:hypothetical protein